jgi:hypothetical protein
MLAPPPPSPFPPALPGGCWLLRVCRVELMLGTPPITAVRAATISFYPPLPSLLRCLVAGASGGVFQHMSGINQVHIKNLTLNPAMSTHQGSSRMCHETYLVCAGWS